jgi:hypothetical protein
MTAICSKVRPIADMLRMPTKHQVQRHNSEATMRNVSRLFILAAILFPALNSCGTGSFPSTTSSALTATFTPPAQIPILFTPTPTAIPRGKSIVVTSAEDSGPSTIRQALLDAKQGDTITFDPKAFPPDNPTTIFLKVEGQDVALPEITQGYLTIDASNAGVILDGSGVRGEWVNGLSIRSDWNTIWGLQIVKFPGSGIGIMGGAKNNTIGGDRNLGSGPLGQGNLTSDNRTGIDLQGNDTSFNSVAGNFVGTDTNGLPARGNQDTGIHLANGANHNTIGPGNTIAYNSLGIQINKANSQSNIITQNSIHDNSQVGIFISAEGNDNSTAPSIIGYNITGGTITVFTCPRCAVEIYSDKGTQGEIFEIKGSADDAGILTLDKGAPFKGPHLTAIATDRDGNTSGFALPTSGASQPTLDVPGSKLIQAENTLSMIGLIPKPSSELEDNRMGTITSSLWHPEREPEVYPDLTLDPSNILNMGFKRFRFTINSLETSTIDWNKPELAVDPGHDEFITTLANSGVKITYVLSFWDTARAAQGGELAYPRFKTEAEITRYLEYVKFIVHHFKDRIEYYEIWNEPNNPNPDYTPQQIGVEDYIKLVERVVPVIRQEYPQGKIVVGGTTSLIDSDSQTYLFKILGSDVMPSVDVISWHPMYGSSPEYDIHKQYYYGYPALVQKIKDTATAHGFKGEFAADEIHWPTPSQPEEGWPTYSNIQSVKYLTRSIIMHLGMDISATQLLLVNNPQLYRTNAYLSTVMAGNKAISLPASIQSEAPNIQSYGFSLPNGDTLLALWNDGAAIDYDPGMLSTVNLPGFANRNAAAIDVLNGVEQKLITSDQNGDLIIRGFLLKDYPIIIRLTK